MTEEHAQGGALVISIDLEGIWGIRDIVPRDGGTQRENLRGTAESVRGTLELFREFGTHATWAVVGMMMLDSPEDCMKHLPAVKPHYSDRRLNPYTDLPDAESDDLDFWFAPDLVRDILDAPNQEVGTQTFSHYYCMEAGQSPEAFRADLEAAQWAADRSGVSLKSIVFPRNQANPRYLSILTEVGIEAYRGNEAGWMHAPRAHKRWHPARVGRLIDGLVAPGRNKCQKWNDVIDGKGLANVRAGRFLRPITGHRTLDKLRFERTKGLLKQAASEGEIFHLWWHPENYGVNTEANLGMLRAVLEHAEYCSSEWGLASLNMLETRRAARA